MHEKIINLINQALQTRPDTLIALTLLIAVATLAWIAVSLLNQ